MDPPPQQRVRRRGPASGGACRWAVLHLEHAAVLTQLCCRLMYTVVAVGALGGLLFGFDTGQLVPAALLLLP